MRVLLRVVLGGIGGLIAGAVLGFGAALVLMSADGSPRTDGTFGMLEVFTLVPGGAICGSVAGATWALRRPRA